MASRHVQSPNSVIPSALSGSSRNPDARIHRRTTSRAAEQLTPTAVMWLKNPPRMVPEHALAVAAVRAFPFANGVNATVASKVAIIRRVGRRTWSSLELGSTFDASVMLCPGKRPVNARVHSAASLNRCLTPVDPGGSTLGSRLSWR
jgi:hypothetical protein